MADEFFSNSVDDSKENLVYNVNDNIDNQKTESLNSDDKRKIKAVALLSGGLDSNLAVRMVKDQGIDVQAVAIKTPFCDFDCGKGCGHKVLEVSSELDIELKTVYLGKEYLSMLKNPRHGYGSGMNPCIDCRMMMYDEARKHMEEIGADFLITGEVLHQRPMSQNSNALSVIEKETGMEGKVIRPLSAQLLPKTKAEKEGLVDRSLLGSIQGRSRKEQLKLATKYGISNPPNSAGGCLLTDPHFAKRIRDLMQYNISEPSINDVELLKIGRHFRLNKFSKLIVGRNHSENESILSLLLDSDYLIEPVDITGPVSILRINGKPDLRKYKKLLMCAIGITLRYSDVLPGKKSDVKVTNTLSRTNKIITSLPYSIVEVEKFRI
ncbi:MAG: tRNA (5-methylaminomethyl-2-thiouridylate)-methyltransferase [Candidatus Nitrosocosmicus sp.]